MRFYPSQPLFWGVALEGDKFEIASLEQINREIRQRAQFIEFYLQWPQPGQKENPPFPKETLEAIWKTKAVPCITWEPMYFENNEETAVLWADIQQGIYDHYLHHFAQEVKQLPFPIIIRFAHEMNLERYHWGAFKQNYGQDNPEIYKKMYAYVVEQFKKIHANNVLWAFCPNADSIPNAPWNKASNYYTGDE
jgi:mannan endo-1,4-beta-mannosidase